MTITKEHVRRYVRFHLRRDSTYEPTVRVKQWAAQAPADADPVEWVTEMLWEKIISRDRETIAIFHTQRE